MATRFGLRDEAQELLLAATSEGRNQGDILEIRLSRGRSFRAGTVDLGDLDNPRSTGLYDEGLRQVLDHGLVRPVPQPRGGIVYEVTAEGYRVADQLRES